MGARWFNAVLAAVACGAGLVWTAVAAFLIPATRDFDARLFFEFLTLRRPRIYPMAIDFVQLGDPRPFAALAAALVGVALVRREMRLAVAVAVALAGSTLMTQILKQLTATPRHPVSLPDASWPSGHTTAMAALSLCLILVAPPRLRGLATAVGATATLAMGYSILVIGTHHLSDVLGGILVAGLWTWSAVAGLGALAERRAPRRPGGGPRVVALLGPTAVVATVGAVVAFSRRSSIVMFVSDRWGFAAGALLLATAAFGVAAATAMLLNALTREPVSRSLP